ncbi:MAG: UDP-N-acetylmuramoyl-L-alanine--D-glutamate ligase [Saprospiraceae bacterium]
MELVVILGAGESGVGAALLAKEQGFEVWVSEKGKIQDHYKKELEINQIPFEAGMHNWEKIKNASFIIKSPGIPDKVEIIQKAKAIQIPVISEIEFASRYTQSLIIGITGSNGKTTTTNLCYHLLKNGGLDVQMGGNVGKSFARLLTEGNAAVYVLELSSFQLDDIVDFRPHISIILNITPDHLDRYDYELEKYADAKFRITENQKSDDVFIYNAENEVILNGIAKRNIGCQTIGIRVPENDFELEEFAYSFEKTLLKGPHNRFNAACAITIAWLMNIEKDKIQEGLNSFIPVAHRMELVATVNGVEYINDSKATNVDAVYFALMAMDKPVVWIAGGQDKGNDYQPLMRLVEEKVKAIVCLGIDNEKIKETFSKLCKPIVEAASSAAAVKHAKDLAQEGDVVLLSPACASFDLFKNYEDRGDQFKKNVNELLEK